MSREYVTICEGCDKVIKEGEEVYITTPASEEGGIAQLTDLHDDPRCMMRYARRVWSEMKKTKTAKPPAPTAEKK